MAETVMPVTKRTGAAIAVGFLCTVAATVAFWSGPLLTASGSMHSSTVSAVHAAAHVSR